MAELIRRCWPGDPGAATRSGRHSCDYKAYVPDPLQGRQFTTSYEAAARIAHAETAMASLNAEGSSLDVGALTRLLARAEAIASSRIEGFDVGARKLLRAEAARTAGEQPIDMLVREVLGNVNAMNSALAEINSGDLITPDLLLKFHSRLFAGTVYRQNAGKLRERQNWIGGNDYNPSSATFVPPPPELVPDLIDDLCAFCNTDSLPGVAQAAVAHAQFETIHPFIDGNGRTGRGLIQLVLRRRGLGICLPTPISVILATCARDYVNGLVATRYLGPASSPEAHVRLNRWLGQFAGICLRAVQESALFEGFIQQLVAGWRDHLDSIRMDSATELLLRAISGSPILTASSAADLIGLSSLQTNEAIGRLVESGILTQVTIGKRNRAFEAKPIINALIDFERQLITTNNSNKFSPRAISVTPGSLDDDTEDHSITLNSSLTQGSEDEPEGAASELEKIPPWVRPGSKIHLGKKPCKYGHLPPWRYDGSYACVWCMHSPQRLAQSDRYSRREWRKIALNAARLRAKEAGVPFDLTEDDLPDIPDTCPALGIRLRDPRARGSAADDSPSLDRLIPGRGYVPGNIAWISLRANTIKSDATLSELRMVVRYLESAGIEDLGSTRRGRGSRR